MTVFKAAFGMLCQAVGRAMEIRNARTLRYNTHTINTPPFQLFRCRTAALSENKVRHVPR